MWSGEALYRELIWSAAAVQPLTTPETPFWSHLLKVGAVLCGLLGILLLCQWGWKKMGSPGQSRQPLIQVIDTHFLAPKRALLLVEVDKDRFLLAHTGEGLHLVAALRKWGPEETLPSAQNSVQIVSSFALPDKGSP